MPRHMPLPYSPYAEFKARRAFTLNGKDLQAGDQIDKSGLTERKLRLLFDARKIEPLMGFGAPPPAFAAKPAPHAQKLIEDAKREAEAASVTSPPAPPPPPPAQAVASPTAKPPTPKPAPKPTKPPPKAVRAHPKPNGASKRVSART